MRTLHFGLRVADQGRSPAFYEAVGYQVVGSVPETGLGHLTMLKLRDDDFLTLELVHDPSRHSDPGSGLSHFGIQVPTMDAALDRLANGIAVEEAGSPNGSADFRTTSVTDPDGNRIELVQWPPRRPDGFTAADWSP